MDSVLKRLGLRKNESRDSDAKHQLQKDLFEINRCSKCGFPSKPTAIDSDSKLGLLGIGTKFGGLRIYGQPGVYFQGQHKNDVSVNHIFFLPGQARIVTVCGDNSIHLWELTQKEADLSVLDVKKSFSLEASRLKAISSCCVNTSGDQLFIGTEGGSVYFLDLSTFVLSFKSISQDAITAHGIEENGDSLGAIEAISLHPAASDKILIGYNRGYIVLWDLTADSVEMTYNSMQQLESLAFNHDGSEFISSHSDGSYIIWSTADPSTPREPATTPYGPFPCKSITKLAWNTNESESYIIFTGGMPRASHGDRYTVSVMRGDDSHVVLDFTSKVVDFIVLGSKEESTSNDTSDRANPHSLIILAEEELVAVDLMSNSWPLFRLPYLNSLHCSAITCVSHVSNVPDALWNKIVDAGNMQFIGSSSREWPFVGGRSIFTEVRDQDLLLTGHEDGSVRFWSTTFGAIRLVYKLETANLFGIDTSLHNDGGNAESDEEWPPFRKVGLYDPFTDDPRLAIKKIAFCLLSETLVLAGMAGQIIQSQFEREEGNQDIKTSAVNLVAECENFIWRGHNALEVRSGEFRLAPGFHPTCVVQLHPPVACSALILHPGWQLFSFGTTYGFGVFDYVQRKTAYVRCTLASTDESGSPKGQVPASRRKSVQKMVRESFRRINRARSELRQRTADRKAARRSLSSSKAEKSRQSESTGKGRSIEVAENAENNQSEPVASTASVPEGYAGLSSAGSTVQCLYFAETLPFLGQTLPSGGGSLWAGTNHGVIWAYQIVLPSSDRRDTDPVQCTLVKEIRLKHGAPVINICVLDRAGHPLPAPLEVQYERAKAPDLTGSHYVVVCSQQQIKVFSLPGLKAYHKLKLSSHATQEDGSVLLAKIAYASFRSRTDESYVETDLVGLTSDGDLSVFTVPQLKRQLSTNVIQKDCTNGISLCVFTPNGQGYYLCSSSEFEQFSLSSRFSYHPSCSILPEEGIKNLVLASESSVRPDLLSDVVDASVAHENSDRTSLSRNQDNIQTEDAGTVPSGGDQVNSLPPGDHVINSPPGHQVSTPGHPVNSVPSSDHVPGLLDNNHQQAAGSVVNFPSNGTEHREEVAVSTVMISVPEKLTMSSSPVVFNEMSKLREMIVPDNDTAVGAGITASAHG